MKNKFITLIFIFFILAGSIIAWTYPVKSYSYEENRALQKAPDFTFENLIKGKYISDFEKFTTDQFPKRNSWVALKNYFDLALGKKDNGKVYFGDKETLFSMDKIDKKQQKNNAKILGKILGNLRLSNPQIRTSVMIAPMAFDVWKDRLPPYAKVPDIMQVDGIFEPVTKKNGASYIKTFDEIYEKRNDEIYYKTDHHWTTYGAFVASNVFKKANGFHERKISDYDIIEVSNKFYGTHQSKTNMNNYSHDSIKRYDLKIPMDIKITRKELGNKKITEQQSLYFPKYLKMKDKYSYFLGGNSGEIKIINVKKGLGSINGEPFYECEEEKNLLVIRDSYANCFIPFIVENYDKIIAVDFRYFRGSLKQLVINEKITDALILYNEVQMSNDRNFAYGMF